MRMIFNLVILLICAISCGAEKKTRTARQAEQWNKKQVAIPLMKYDCQNNLYCPYSKEDWKDVGSSQPKNKQFQIMKKMRELQNSQGYGSSKRGN